MEQLLKIFFPIPDLRRRILRISCAHFLDSFRLKGKGIMGQASHRNEEERKSTELKDRVETSGFTG